jgi:hypothetical protein
MLLFAISQARPEELESPSESMPSATETRLACAPRSLAITVHRQGKPPFSAIRGCAISNPNKPAGRGSSRAPALTAVRPPSAMDGRSAAGLRDAPSPPVQPSARLNGLGGIRWLCRPGHWLGTFSFLCEPKTLVVSPGSRSLRLAQRARRCWSTDGAQN